MCTSFLFVYILVLLCTSTRPRPVLNIDVRSPRILELKCEEHVDGTVYTIFERKKVGTTTYENIFSVVNNASLCKVLNQTPDMDSFCTCEYKSYASCTVTDIHQANVRDQWKCRTFINDRLHRESDPFSIPFVEYMIAIGITGTKQSMSDLSVINLTEPSLISTMGKETSVQLSETITAVYNVTNSEHKTTEATIKIFPFGDLPVVIIIAAMGCLVMIAVLAVVCMFRKLQRYAGRSTTDDQAPMFEVGRIPMIPSSSITSNLQERNIMSTTFSDLVNLNEHTSANVHNDDIIPETQTETQYDEIADLSDQDEASTLPRFASRLCAL
ncbi:uncharacterized protein LOC127850719 isoform X1 [Dreissena polymorpha]|uniref:uncharacterized protein LOC127850719 isoform X1 n=2 Tax=Dreissena polymorpha TaxID=45954 RepID=UPI002264DF08|nr:uncharacterized protein LOC127850719 isoform X1 [Dreissena polymorpha]